MNNYHALTYDELYVGTLRFSAWNGTISESLTEMRTRQFRNKLAVFSTERYGANFSDKVRQQLSRYIWKGNKIFVSSAVRTARDIFRNSGYKIVRDKESADKIVIPKVIENHPMLYFDVVAYYPSTKRLKLFTVDRNLEYRQTSAKSAEDDFEQIKNYLTQYGATLFQESLLFNQECEFVSNYPEYAEIYEADNNSLYRYIEEQELEVDYPTEINLDTLKFWDKFEDDEMLARAICNSDWKKYPTTLVCFLSQVKPHARHQGGTNFKLILDSIGFDYYCDIEDVLQGREIQPEDWNLLQDYIMYKLGLPPEGGFTASNVFKANSISWAFDIVRKRACVAPIKLKTPMTFENIVSVAENS